MDGSEGKGLLYTGAAKRSILPHLLVGTPLLPTHVVFDTERSAWQRGNQPTMGTKQH